MRTRIKVCCISSFEEAKLAIELGADALGLVAHMPSGPGVIGDELVHQIASRVCPPVSTFLLTSQTQAVDIAKHVKFCGTDTVQIVSHVDPNELAALKYILPSTRRVQVIHIEGPESLTLLDRYVEHVHAFLLDSGRPMATVPELGGTGRIHDWSTSAEFVRRSPHPVFLAGGLRPENVAEAIQRVRPFGVDLCSGVRTDGKLDATKLSWCVKAVARSFN